MSVERILIPVGEQKETARALEVGSAMARDFGANVRLVYVIDPRLASPPEGGVCRELVLADLRHTGQEILDTAFARMPGDLQIDTTLVEGHPANAINSAARQWDADMIVMGTHGRKGLLRFLFGSVSESVIRQAPCPVVTVRANERFGPPVPASPSGTHCREAYLAGQRS